MPVLDRDRIQTQRVDLDRDQIQPVLVLPADGLRVLLRLLHRELMQRQLRQRVLKLIGRLRRVAQRQHVSQRLVLLGHRHAAIDHATEGEPALPLADREIRRDVDALDDALPAIGGAPIELADLDLGFLLVNELRYVPHHPLEVTMLLPTRVTDSLRWRW